MSGITIPLAALEAGARAMCLAHGYWWDGHPDFHDAWREEARAAFLAVLAAWPGMTYMEQNLANGIIILPLTEQTDG